MHALNVPLGQRAYPVLIGRGMLGRTEVLAPYLDGRQVMVITNESSRPCG
jgi:3-dehydroquinate synthase